MTKLIYTQRTIITLLACFLSDKQQEGLISLLLKQDPSGIYKDPVHLQNRRPLPPQCCDAKFYLNVWRIELKRYCKIRFILIRQVFYMDDTLEII